MSFPNLPASSIPVPEYNPQLQSVVKHLHFVWMGNRNGFGIPDPQARVVDGDGNFRTKMVLDNLARNPDCTATLWLDLFTLMPEFHGSAIDRATLVKYNSWAKQAQLPRHGGIERPLFSMDPRDPANFDKITEMLRQARLQFARFCRDHVQAMQRGSRALRQTLAYFNGTKLNVQFLDVDVYPGWMEYRRGEQYNKLVDFVFFELYMRGGNVTAAIDMVRTQLLIRYGGISVAHDLPLPWVNDPETLPMVPGAPALPARQRSYTGFRYLLVGGANAAYYAEMEHSYATIAYLAGPPNHPFLICFRDRMIQEYGRLLANNYIWKLDNGDPGGQPPDDKWLDFQRAGVGIYRGNFLEYTSYATGARQLQRTCGAMAKPMVLSNGTTIPDPNYIITSEEGRLRRHGP